MPQVMDFDESELVWSQMSRGYVSGMPSIDDIAAEYVERAAALDPCYATSAEIR